MKGLVISPYEALGTNHFSELFKLDVMCETTRFLTAWRPFNLKFLQCAYNNL